MSRIAIAIVLLAACFHDKHDDATAQRLAHIEQRLEEQDKRIAALTSRADEADKRTDQVVLPLLANKLEDLNGKIEKLEHDMTAPRVGAAAPAGQVHHGLDPAVTYAVPLGTDPQLGSPKAKVTMVMVFEFACPYCRRAWDTVDALRQKYGKDLRVVYKTLVIHPTLATYAANAACAANHQGKWRQMAELLWTKAFDARNFDQGNIDAIAGEVGLDTAQYQRDMSDACPKEVAADAEAMRKLAIAATPTFFINGRYVQGAREQPEFEKLIDEEMAKATAAIKKGVKPEKYYDQEVIGKGVAVAPTP